MSSVRSINRSMTTHDVERLMVQEDIFRTADSGYDLSDPNNSYELRDMVSVAASYFDRGMIDDADEMLQEALAAGYTRQDAIDLNIRIRSILGDDLAVSVVPTASSIGVEEANDQAHFTIPLPGAQTQTPILQLVLKDSEADIASGRLQSAYDATLHALAIAPSYFPIYIRLAELRLALNDPDGAANLVTTLQDCIDAWGDDADWLMLALRVALDPSDLDSLLRLARATIAQKGTIALDPYVPDAIVRTMDTDPATAVELSAAYVQLEPTLEQATRLHLRAILNAGDDHQMMESIIRDVGPDSAADLLFVRSAIARRESREVWFHWLERTVARLLTHPAEFSEIPRAIEAARSLLDAAQHSLATAIVRYAGGDYLGVLDVLTPWNDRSRLSAANAAEMLVASCARAFSLRETSPIESIEAFAIAVAQAVVIDVRPFAESCRLLTHPLSAEALMYELVKVSRETGQQELAIAHLQALRDRLPEHLEIRTGLADLQVAAGRVLDGVKELRYIAERYEQAGNLERMVDAMRHISQAVPNNTEMKSKLIDGYIQRGIPDEAIRELRLLGDLHLQRGRAQEAAVAYTRGAEIAATTGSSRRAMDLFDRAVAADPDNVAHRHAAVAFYIMNGAVEKATQQLRDIVRIALQENDPDEAVAALHQIIGLAPTDAPAYHRLGEVLTSLGEYTQAERVYRRLAAFTPDDPVLAAKQSALAALASGN